MLIFNLISFHLKISYLFNTEIFTHISFFHTKSGCILARQGHPQPIQYQGKAFQTTGNSSKPVLSGLHLLQVSLKAHEQDKLNKCVLTNSSNIWSGDKDSLFIYNFISLVFHSSSKCILRRQFSAGIFLVEQTAFIRNMKFNIGSEIHSLNINGVRQKLGRGHLPRS